MRGPLARPVVRRRRRRTSQQVGRSVLMSRGREGVTSTSAAAAASQPASKGGVGGGGGGGGGGGEGGMNCGVTCRPSNVLDHHDPPTKGRPLRSILDVSPVQSSPAQSSRVVVIGFIRYY